MMKNKWFVVLLSLCFFTKVEAVSIQMNGFGSGRFSKPLSHDVKKGSLNGTRGNFGEDSLVGLNIASSISDRIDIAAQFVAGGQNVSTGTIGSSNWDLNANWAFVSFKALDNLKLKYGRQLLPNWLAAEYEKVAFLQPYRELPKAMRAVSYFYSFNGLLTEYVIPLRKGNISISAWAGDLDVEVETLGISAKGTASNIYGSSFTFSYDGWKFHTQYSLNDLDYVSNTTNTNILSINKTEQYNFGLIYEKHNIVVWTEYGQVHTSNSVNFGGNGNLFEKAEAFYVLFGYRFGKFLPRVTYSRANTIRYGLASLEGKEQVVNLGVNYQLHSQAIFKLDYERGFLENEFNGVTYRRSSSSSKNTGGTIQASIDFIF